jgi:PAS domain S-box-containing protein
MVEDITVSPALANSAPSEKMLTEASSISKPQINGRCDYMNSKKTEYSIDNDWMEGIAVPVFALDLSLNVTAWNQLAAESIGLRAQEMIEMPMASILQDNSRARLENAIQELIQEGDSSSSCDLTFCINGSLRSFHTKISAQKNTSKELIGVVCFTEEIRPPIHPAPTSPIFEKSEPDSMSSVFDNCDFPTVGLNLEGNIQSWSTSMVILSGYTKEEVTGRQFSEYAAAERYRQRVNAMVRATTQGKRSKPFQFELRDRHGQTRKLLLNVSASRDQNRTACGIIMVITDLSDESSSSTDGSDDPTPKRIVFTSHNVEVEERNPLFESDTVPIFSIDRDGSNTSWNPKMSSLTGFGQQEALDGRFVRDFVCPDFQSSTQQYFERSLTGSESSFETEIKSKDGKNIRLSLNVCSAQFQDHGLIVFATDVTTIFERWKAAEEFKMLVDTANAPVFGIDRNGCIDLWNSMAVRVLGFSRDFVMGKSLVETFIDPILRHSVQVILDKALEGHGTSNYELEFQTESGEIRYLLANITTRWDAGGKIVLGVVGFAQDVTEAAQHDRAVATMARELRQLLDTANTPIFGVDTTGRVNEWNEKAAEITGFSGDEAFNESFVETFMVPDLRASMQEVVDNALRGRGTSNFELEIRNKANEIRFLLVNATTRRDAENNVVGMVCVAQDVTEACKHDRAVAAMANELRQLIDTANAPIFGIDRDGYVFVFCFFAFCHANQNLTLPFSLAMSMNGMIRLPKLLDTPKKKRLIVHWLKPLLYRPCEIQCKMFWITR